MPQRFEGHFQAADETDLFFQTWTPTEKARGTLVITHGLSEHSECYHALAKTLSDDGWQVFAWDLRGHGRSEGKRGYAPSLNTYVEDFESFYGFLQSQLGPETVVFFGHSMGGLITIRYLETRQPKITAACFSSPALGLSVRVPKLKEQAALFANKWWPTLTLFNEIQYRDLTRDEEMIRSFEKDTLRHDKISPGVFLGMLETFPRAMEDAAALDMPVLMQLAGVDKIVSTIAARAFFDRLPNKKNQIEIYSGSFHEIYNDLDRDKVVADLKRFINPLLGA